MKKRHCKVIKMLLDPSGNNKDLVVLPCPVVAIHPAIMMFIPVTPRRE